MAREMGDPAALGGAPAAPPPRAAAPAPAAPEGRAAALARARAALGAAVEARAPELKVVAQRRDVDGPMLDRALALVRDFIAARGLILFGGLAIDYALRARGGALYPDDERPDYDFLSPRSVDDAYDLADLLTKAGFEEVAAIGAVHVQSMRVRTRLVVVADIGYVPLSVFARIPTLTRDGVRYVDPAFQAMDMHLAFCYPFSSAPMEDIFHRWRKDLKRWNLLADAGAFGGLVPAPAKAPAAAPAAAPAPALASAVSGLPLAAPPGAGEVALHGFAAYAALRRCCPGPTSALPLPLELAPDGRALRVGAPRGVPPGVVLASPEPRAAAGAGAAEFAPFMDTTPATFVRGELTVFSTRGRQLAVGAVPAAALGLEGGAALEVLVVTPPFLLLWFLQESHRAADSEAAAVYRAFYAHTLALLRDAEAAIVGAAGGGAAGAAAFAASPFAPSVRVMGRVNTDAAYLIRIAKNAQQLRDEPPAALGLDPGVTALAKGLPQNYYPSQGKARPPPYDYGANPFFTRAGEPAGGAVAEKARPA
jgi:hypothetical protein